VIGKAGHHIWTPLNPGGVGILRNKVVDETA